MNEIYHRQDLGYDCKPLGTHFHGRRTAMTCSFSEHAFFTFRLCHEISMETIRVFLDGNVQEHHY